MKHRLSISVDESTIKHLREISLTRRFRNKSHAVEYAIENMMKR